MRILLISGEFPPMQGGVGDYTREMARAFAACGHEVFVLIPASLADAHEGKTPLPWRVFPIVRNWGWGCWRSILSVVHEIRPDVIDIQYQAAAYDMRTPAMNFVPWRLGLVRDAPMVVVTYHDLKPPYLFPKAGPVRGWVVRQLARYSDAAIVTNVEDLLATGEWPFVHRLARPSMHHIPIGSNIPVAPPADYDRPAWRTQHGYGTADFLWGYFGFLNESKGGESLIRALALAPPEHHLLMIGGRVGSSDPTNQAYAAHVEGLMTSLGVADRVQWTGYSTSTAQVSAALLSTDIVVLPYRDGISFRRGSLHAALAHGCPVVSTTPHVSIPELSEGKNVLLVQAGDPAPLSRAAVRLQRDPARRRRIGDGAEELAGLFTWDRIAERTVKEVFVPLARDRRAE